MRRRASAESVSTLGEGTTYSPIFLPCRGVVLAQSRGLVCKSHHLTPTLASGHPNLQCSWEVHWLLGAQRGRHPGRQPEVGTQQQPQLLAGALRLPQGKHQYLFRR